MTPFTLFVLLIAVSSWSIKRLFMINDILGSLLMIIAIASYQMIFITQILSLLHMLTPNIFLCSNLITSMIVIAINYRNIKPILIIDGINKAFGSLKNTILSSKATLFLFIFFVVNSLIIFILANLIYPSGDLYHVEAPKFWLQNESILPFVVDNVRITSFSFGKEVLSLPFFMYLKSAKFTFIFDYFSYLSIPALVYKVSQKCNFPKTASILTSFVASTFTLLIMVVMNGKGDLMASLFFVLSLYFIIDINVSSENLSGIKTKLIASIVCFILSLSVKNTALLISPVYLLFIVFKCRSNIFKVTMLYPALLAVFFALIGSGSLWLYLSNIIWFKRAAGPANIAETLGYVSFSGVWTKNIRGLIYLFDFTYLPSTLHPVFIRISDFILTTLGASKALMVEGGFYKFIPEYVPLRNALGPVGFLFLLPCILITIINNIYKYLKTKIITYLTDIRFIIAIISLLIFFIFHSVLNWQPQGLLRFAIPFVILSAPLMTIALERKFFRSAILIISSINVILVLISQLISVAYALNYTSNNKFIKSLLTLRPNYAFEVTYQLPDKTQIVDTLSNIATLRDVYAKLMNYLPADINIGYIGGFNSEHYYLFGKHLSNNVIPLADGRFPATIITTKMKLDFIIVNQFDWLSARIYINKYYPQNELFFKVLKKDGDEILMEIYRIL